MIDHSALIGPYPFRSLPEPTPARLVAELERLGVASAWVGHVPAPWYRDVTASNDELLASLAPFRMRLVPALAVNPAWPAWEREVARARAEGGAAVRAYPNHHGFGTAGTALRELAAACAEHDLELLLTVRFEDPRQRSRLDVAPDLIGADVRQALRAHPSLRVLVSAADRAFVEEVHWGSTAAERERVRWDVCGIWGPPDDHLAHLARAIGRDRFVLGSQFPFRLSGNAKLRLDLLE